MTAAGGERPFSAFIIAGEVSGDRLGAELMRALAQRLGGRVRFAGVGGQQMAALGLKSLFPMEDITHHGISSIIGNLPLILRRIREAADAAVRLAPDVLILVDSPDFNLRVARRVRRRNAKLPIVDYVAPTVWAYRPGRARAMAKSVDHILAILPFEPDVIRELGGPDASYVGHPLIERLAELRPSSAGGERRRLGQVRPTLLVLPGSRRSEVKQLMQPFGETLRLIFERYGPVEVILPVVRHVAGAVRAACEDWPIRPYLVEGEDAKLAAFRRAHAALAASGTVTLELALSGVPMVVAYRLDPLAKVVVSTLVRVKSMVLPNLILDANVVPEFLNADSTPERMAEALLPLLDETSERRRQLAGFARLDMLMALDRTTPSARAAEIVLETVRTKRLHAALGARERGREARS